MDMNHIVCVMHTTQMPRAEEGGTVSGLGKCFLLLPWVTPDRTISCITQDRNTQACAAALNTEHKAKGAGSRHGKATNKWLPTKPMRCKGVQKWPWAAQHTTNKGCGGCLPAVRKGKRVLRLVLLNKARKRVAHGKGRGSLKGQQEDSREGRADGLLLVVAWACVRPVYLHSTAPKLCAKVGPLRGEEGAVSAHTHQHAQWSHTRKGNALFVNTKGATVHSIAQRCPGEGALGRKVATRLLVTAWR